MVFSSHLFLFYFLPLTLLLYYAAPRRGKHLILTLVSYVFYGWANPLFVVLMLATTTINYVCGLFIAQALRQPWSEPIPVLPKGSTRSGGQKLALFVSILACLSILGFFKYCNWAMENYDAAVSALRLPGLRMDWALRVALPLGISFYTFQSMSYSMDVYRGRAGAIRNFIDFACYVSMFPQLVAGPIIRFQEIADQLERRTYTAEKLARGAAFICLGFAKKILLANACGKVADLAFGAAGVGFVDAWAGTVAYAFQIYYDFSAYSDMAIGLGLILGFVFPKNFDSPYLSQSITEFWRRWHISLSTWLKDYLYIPLGGNRKGNVRTYVNLMIVMLLGGLWHGAAWNFVIWGGIHGVMLALERAHGKRSFYQRLPRAAKIALTFVIVCFGWVFFRADDLPTAAAYCASMLGLRGAVGGSALVGGLMYQPYYLIMLAAAAVITWTCPQTWDFSRRITLPKAALVILSFWVSIAALTTQAFNPFIYFIF
jgi:alginate O-acetyltransferase complex protein AlgI